MLLTALCLSRTELLFVIFTLQNTVLGILARLKLEKRQKVSKECVTEGQKEQALIVFSLSAICGICTHLFSQGDMRMLLGIMSPSACRQKDAFTKGETY